MAKYEKYPYMVERIAKKYIKKTRPSEAKALWSKTLDIYDRFVEEAPDIGGSENNMSSNLYMALAVFAFYEALDRGITQEEIKDMVNGALPKRIPIVSSVIDFNKPRNQKKMLDRFVKYKALSDERLNGGSWGNSWRVEINPHNREKGVAFDLIGCPLVDFARSHGYEDIMPLICDFDHRTAGLMHARLIREHTISAGGDYCDYWYVGDKEEI